MVGLRRFVHFTFQNDDKMMIMKASVNSDIYIVSIRSLYRVDYHYRQSLKRRRLIFEDDGARRDGWIYHRQILFTVKDLTSYRRAGD